MKNIFALILTAAVFFSFTGCNMLAGETPTPSPEITGSAPGRPIEDLVAADNVFSLNYNSANVFNPLTSSSKLNLLVGQLMYEQFFEVDEKMEFHSDICKDYRTADGKGFVFTINTDIKFHDGSNLTAYDVAYSIRRAMLGTQSQYRERLRAIVIGVSAMSETEVMINLQKVNRQFPALLNIPIIKDGSIEDAVPLGTGPYVMDQESMWLEVFDGHRKASEMPIERIYLKEYTQTEEIITAFEDSLVDLVVNDPTGISNLGYGSANEMRYIPTTHMHFIGFNMDSMFFRFAAHRFAMNYAVDREAVVTEYMNGSAIAATLPILPTSRLYDANFASSYNFSMEKCAQILDNAEVIDFDDDGDRQYIVTGIPLEINLNFIVNIESTAKVMAARRLAENLRGIGISVNLRELSWTNFKKALEEQDFDMYYGEVMLGADFDLSLLLVEGSALNYGNCQDPSYESKIIEYLSAETAEDQKMYADLMCSYIVNTAPIVPVVFERQQVITHRGVVSGMSPTQYNVFNKLTDWVITLR